MLLIKVASIKPTAAAASSSPPLTPPPASSTGPQWLVPPEVLQPEGLLYEPGFGTMGKKCPVNFDIK
jgi:hypothetical protein